MKSRAKQRRESLVVVVILLATGLGVGLAWHIATGAWDSSPVPTSVQP